MILFTVDRNKCTGDGICAAECPPRIIELSGKGSFPVPAEGAEELCIKCGHCVAVCPQGALIHRDLKPEECRPYVKEALFNVDQAEFFLLARRSIRSYKDKPVDREDLKRLVNIASHAPTAHNLQPVHWLVIEDGKSVKHLAGLVVDWMKQMLTMNPEVGRMLRFDSIVAQWEGGVDRICRGAPHIVISHAKETALSAAEACIGSLSYLELAAHAMGLGSCWAGFVNAAANMYPPVKSFLDLPEDHRCFGAVMVGHPKYRYHRIPVRNSTAVIWKQGTQTM
ncbi:MAG: nitroreductase family protein [Bacillota bacterium]